MTTVGRIMVRGAVLSISGMVVTMICALLAAILFTKHVGDQEVGWFSVLLVFSDFLAMAAGFGLWNTLPKLIGAAPESDRSKLIGATIVHQVLSTAGLCALVYLVWFLVPDPARLSSNPTWVSLYPYLWLLPPLFFTANLREIGLALLAGLNRYGLRTLGLTAASVANVALVYLMVVRSHGGFLSLCAATLLSYAIGMACLSGPLLHHVRRGLPWRMYCDAVVFSVPLYINSFLNFIFQRVDTLLVAWFLGPAMAAYFEFGAKKLPVYASRFLQSVTVPFLPSVSVLVVHDDRQGASRLLDRTGGIIAFLGYAGTLSTLLVQEKAISLLFKESYLGGISALGLVMVSTCLAVQSGIMGLSLIALNKPHLVMLINIIAAIVSAGANLLLIPAFGIVGAGWAAVASAAFSNAGQMWFVRRHGLEINLRRYLQPHLLMAVAGALAWAVPSPLGRLMGLAVFLVMSCLVGVISVRDLRLALEVIRVRTHSR